MSWGEAYRLTQILRSDPSARTCAAVEGWDHPVPAEVVAIGDLFNLFARAHFEKAEPYPMPWRKKSKVFGQGTELTTEQFRDRWARLSAAAERRREQGA